MYGSFAQTVNIKAVSTSTRFAGSASFEPGPLMNVPVWVMLQLLYLMAVQDFWRSYNKFCCFKYFRNMDARKYNSCNTYHELLS